MLGACYLLNTPILAEDRQENREAFRTNQRHCSKKHYLREHKERVKPPSVDVLQAQLCAHTLRAAVARTRLRARETATPDLT